MKNRKIILGVILVLLTSFSLIGATNTASVSTNAGGSSIDGSGSAFKLNGEIAAITIDGETYSQIIMKPEINLKKFGLGLDLNFEIDKDGNIREGEWDSWQAVVNKIRYLRLGELGSKFFFKIGNLESVSIGHGTIMGGFSNNIFFPDIRMLGIRLNLDFGLFGFESFVDNFLDYDIFAGRVYIKPLRKSGIPILKRIALGASAAIDLDNQNPLVTGKNKYEYADASNSTNDLYVYGLDIDLPMPSLGILTWTFFADYVTINRQGSGLTTGFAGKLIWLFDWKLEYMRYGKNFVGPFFDQLYLAERSTKYSSLDAITEAYNGWKLTIWKNFSLTAPNDLTVSLEYKADENDDPSIHFLLHVDQKLLFDKVSLDLDYTRTDIATFKDVFKIEDLNAVITLKLGYVVAEGVMMSVTHTRSFQDDGTGTLKTLDSTSISTEFVF